MDVLQVILISIFSGASGGGILHSILKIYLTKKIKSQIELEYNIKFEITKKELERQATEHQIQYSKLHLDRAEKLNEIYVKLIEVEKSLKDLTNPANSNWTKVEQKEINSKEQLAKLQFLILINRIYFDEDLCEKLDNIIIEFDDVINIMLEGKLQSDYEIESRDYSKPTPFQIWLQQRDRVNNDIVKARDFIVIEFRKILGV